VGLWITLFTTCGQAVDKLWTTGRSRRACGKEGGYEHSVHRETVGFPQNYQQEIVRVERAREGFSTVSTGPYYYYY
jgi:hypothetical protein